MALLSIGPLNAMSVIFVLIKAADGDPVSIDLVSIGTIKTRIPGAQSLDQAGGGVSVTTATFPVNQLACRAIISFPDPQLVLFFWTKCHISSSSSTMARPCGSGLLAKASAIRSIHSWMVGVDTPSNTESG